MKLYTEQEVRDIIDLTWKYAQSPPSKNMATPSTTSQDCILELAQTQRIADYPTRANKSLAELIREDRGRRDKFTPQ